MAQSSNVATSSEVPRYQLLVFQYWCCDWQAQGRSHFEKFLTYSSKDELKKFFDDEFEVSKHKKKECQKDFWENFEENWNKGMTDCDNENDCSCGKIYIYGDIGKIETDVLLETENFECVWPNYFDKYDSDEDEDDSDNEDEEEKEDDNDKEEDEDDDEDDDDDEEEDEEGPKEFEKAMIVKFNPRHVKEIIAKPDFDPNFVDPDTEESHFEIIVQGAREVTTSQYATFAVELIGRLKKMGGTNIEPALELAKWALDHESENMRKRNYQKSYNISQAVESLKQIIVALENKE